MNCLTKPLPSFDEPLEMLEACHDKIEAQLDALEKLLPHVAAHGADDAARSAARAVIRYFDTAAVAHQADEDEDLFPLVRAAAARGGRNVVGATLYELEREHESMDRLYSELRAALDSIAKGEAECLDAELVSRFAWLHRRHMRLESTLILPFAREALEPGQCAMLGERMAARRQKIVPA